MKNLKTVRISFLLLMSRAKEEDENLVLYCKLSLNKIEKRFSTGIQIPIHLWDSKQQRVTGKSELAQRLNRKINDFKRTIELAESSFERANEDYTVDDIYNKVSGKDTAPFRNLLQVYDYNFKQMKKLEGIDYKASTVAKNALMKNVVKRYINEEMGLPDIALTKVDLKFLTELEFYLKSDRKLAVATINKIIQKLKAMMKLAFDFGVIQKSAFPNHKFKHERPKVIYLTMDELAKIENSKFAQERLALIKDLFLFSVYTGLHYIDAMSLTEDNLVTGVDGKQWINYTRQKTGVDIDIPLLDKTKELLASFKQNFDTKEYLLPRFSNQKINSYLKEIADILGIDKSLSHKVARKTFGSVLLYYNMPMKVVSKLMGHSSIIITERHYAQVELKKLGNEMELINELLKDK